MQKRLDKNKTWIILINIGCVLSLLAVIFPLLLVAKYDYPSADDWSYGVSAYKVLKAGGNFIQVLKAALQRAVEAYLGWDGRYANDFIDSLQPGIWGEEYYVLTPWILIGMLILSEMFFFRSVICCGMNRKTNALLWIPVVVPVLIVQILFTPSPVESFYWYTGGMNYTFMYSLSFILIVLFIYLGIKEFGSKRQRIFWGVVAWILSIFVGGGNFSTSLSVIVLLCTITMLFLWRKKGFFLRKTWYIILTTAVCLMICLVSPGSIKGNSARMTEMGSPLQAVWRSLVVSADNIRIWTFTGEVLFLLLFVIPFIWRAIDNLEISFRYPFLFSALTFGIYASQAVPNMYAFGGIGGGRVAAILYYSYIVWLTGNVFYWLGWLKKKGIAGCRVVLGQLTGDVPLFLYCCMTGFAMIAFIGIFEKHNVSSYKAYRDWKQGLAQEYAEMWKSRLEILHDDSVKKIEFTPIQYYPETLLYIELQEDADHISYWVNDACAIYYGKEYIHMVKLQEDDSHQKP